MARIFTYILTGLLTFVLNNAVFLSDFELQQTMVRHKSIIKREICIIKFSPTVIRAHKYINNVNIRQLDLENSSEILCKTKINNN